MATIDHLVIIEEVHKKGDHSLSRQPSVEQGFIRFLPEGTALPPKSSLLKDAHEYLIKNRKSHICDITLQL